MRFASVRSGGRIGLAVQSGGVKVSCEDEAGFPGHLDQLIGEGAGALKAAFESVSTSGASVDEASLEFLPPFAKPPKIICLGLNYSDHAAEGGFEAPTYPTLFGRFASSLIGHGQPIVRPKISDKLDYEAELVAVIGQGGRHIAKDKALDHVAGYSLFNDGSIRDYQMRTPQWTIGKNFDGTGAFGPWFVTPDELPPGAKGLKIECRLNGQVMQTASTTDMIFDVETTIALLSEAMTLEAGDVLVMGTPSGVGAARKPPVFMKAGDVCEVEMEQVGLLRNPIVDEA